MYAPNPKPMQLSQSSRVLRGRELAQLEVFTEYGEIDRHAKAARYFAMVYAAKLECFEQLNAIHEKLVV